MDYHTLTPGVDARLRLPSPAAAASARRAAGSGHRGLSCAARYTAARRHPRPLPQELFRLPPGQPRRLLTSPALAPVDVPPVCSASGLAKARKQKAPGKPGMKGPVMVEARGIPLGTFGCAGRRGGW
jgi:hypothetical protein